MDLVEKKKLVMARVLQKMPEFLIFHEINGFKDFRKKKPRNPNPKPRNPDFQKVISHDHQRIFKHFNNQIYSTSS